MVLLLKYMYLGILHLLCFSNVVNGCLIMCTCLKAHEKGETLHNVQSLPGEWSLQQTLLMMIHVHFHYRFELVRHTLPVPAVLTCWFRSPGEVIIGAFIVNVKVIVNALYIHSLVAWPQ